LADSFTAMMNRTDELTLTWGSLAPYVNCPPDSTCGAQSVPMGLADLPEVRSLDPYIQCSMEGSGGVCSADTSAEVAICQDWGSGFIDPLPPY